MGTTRIVYLVLAMESMLGQRPRIDTTAAGTNCILENVESAEDLFKAAGFEAVVHRFEGGFPTFWVEVNTGGKKKTYGPLSVPDDIEKSMPRQTRRGHFLWVREQARFEEGPAAKTLKERWRLAIRWDTGQASYKSQYLEVQLPPLEFIQKKAPGVPAPILSRGGEGGAKGKVHLAPGSEAVLWETETSVESRAGPLKRTAVLKCRLATTANKEPSR